MITGSNAAARPTPMYVARYICKWRSMELVDVIGPDRLRTRRAERARRSICLICVELGYGVADIAKALFCGVAHSTVVGLVNSATDLDKSVAKETARAITKAVMNGERLTN